MVNFVTSVRNYVRNRMNPTCVIEAQVADLDMTISRLVDTVDKLVSLASVLVSTNKRLETAVMANVKQVPTAEDVAEALMSNEKFVIKVDADVDCLTETITNDVRAVLENMSISVNVS